MSGVASLAEEKEEVISIQSLLQEFMALVCVGGLPLTSIFRFRRRGLWEELLRQSNYIIIAEDELKGLIEGQYFLRINEIVSTWISNARANNLGDALIDDQLIFMRILITGLYFVKPEDWSAAFLEAFETVATALAALATDHEKTHHSCFCHMEIWIKAANKEELDEKEDLVYVSAMLDILSTKRAIARERVEEIPLRTRVKPKSSWWQTFCDFVKWVVIGDFSSSGVSYDSPSEPWAMPVRRAVENPEEKTDEVLLSNG